MIKVSEIKSVQNNSDGTRVVEVSLKSDTSSEVSALGTSTTGIIGLNASTDTLGFGSTCFTTSCELGVLNSSGVWKF